MPDKKNDEKVIKLKPDELAKIIENFADDMKVQEMLKKGQNPFKDYDKKKDGGIVKPRPNGYLPMNKKILRSFEEQREKKMLRSGKPKIAKRGF
jgi:hypothetical protein